jgi:hypothetical protein
MTPFKALYGRDPPAVTRYTPHHSDPPALQEELLSRDNILQQLKSNLEKAQSYMKKQADKRRSDITFHVGDLVLVKLQPYKQHSVALRKNQKLGMRYFGPFEILARVGEVAYKLKLPEHARIHPVFHVSQLKPFKGTPQGQYMPLPLTMNDFGPIIQPSQILQARTIVRGSQKIHQVLIQWENQSATEATWEDIATLQQKFPSLNLEDKVVFKGEGIVMKEGNILELGDSAIPHVVTSGMHGENGIIPNHPDIVGVRKGGRVRKENTMLKDYVKA